MEESLFVRLLPRFGSSNPDYASFARMWTTVHKEGHYEGEPFTVSLRDRISLKNHFEYLERKKALTGAFAWLE